METLAAARLQAVPEHGRVAYDPRLSDIAPPVLPEPPYVMRRLGTIMRPQRGNAAEAEGVLNPATARGADGETYLFPRLVGRGNYSRIGVARVLRDRAGRPVDVQRLGLAFAPERSWEGNRVTAGVEDPRVVHLGSLGLYVMTYTAYSGIGPRIAFAVSSDLQSWRRLGPVTYRYDDAIGVDMNFIHNKDALLFPEPVPGPKDEPCFAMIHRPNWEHAGSDDNRSVPAALEDPLPGMWISYVPVRNILVPHANGEPNLAALTHFEHHRQLAVPEQEWEAVKIGGGTPPIRVPEGWLVLYHGVSGRLVRGVDQQRWVRYAAGAMILDANDPGRVLYRSRDPILSPDRPEETAGIVPGVVFPTGVDVRSDGTIEVYFGQADAQIGVAELRRRGRR
jgi:predicted GH43/DUF377 family glycosyl hydrolase